MRFCLSADAVSCVRLWCLTVPCRAALANGALPLALVSLLLLLLLLCVIRKRPSVVRGTLVLAAAALVAAPCGHALWRTFVAWCPSKEAGDLVHFRACASRLLPSDSVLHSWVLPAPADPLAWALAAEASLDRQPMPDEYDCVIKPLSCGTGAPATPVVVYPSLDAAMEDTCMAAGSDGTIDASAKAFTPSEWFRARRARCEGQEDSSLMVPIGACHPTGTAMLSPCADPRAQLHPHSRFCAAPLPSRSFDHDARTAHNRTIISVPVIFVEQKEAAIHPGNVNHFFRDMAFVATMLHEAQRQGGRHVYAPAPRSNAAETMGAWQQGMAAVLWRPGCATHARSPEDAIRHAADRMWNTMRREEEDGNTEGGAVDGKHGNARARGNVAKVFFCGQRAQRYTHAISGAHGQAAVAALVREVRAGCSRAASNQSSGTAHPFQQQRRTLALSLRSSGQRPITNGPEALELLKHTAHTLGLQPRPVYFGRLDFCQQVAEAARAKVMIGAHGADLANAFLMPQDAMLVEAVPLFDGDTGIWTEPSTLPIYGQQMAAIGRRYMSVRLLDVNDPWRCGHERAWMYGNCSARINLVRLNATLKIIRHMYKH